MKRPLLVPIWMLSLCATAVGCSNPRSDMCQRFCTFAAGCYILPSPLGTDQGNCASQCQLSDETSFSTLTSCLDVDDPRANAVGDASFPELWCGTNGGPPACAAFSGCLTSSYPGADITGSASMFLLFEATPPAVPADVISNPTDTSCDPPIFPFDVLLTGQLCEMSAITDVTVFIEQTSIQQIAALPCSLAALQGLIVPGLHPGSARPIVEVQANLGPDNTSTCRRFYGPRTLLEANKQGGSFVPIPTTSAVFLTGSPCSDAASIGVRQADAGSGGDAAASSDAAR
jgi:hypothetical protein